MTPASNTPIVPYYEDDLVTLWHGDCRDFVPLMMSPSIVLVTDPPYPNQAGHFAESVDAAREVLGRGTYSEALVFWNELERPPVPMKLVAVHIWHRANVNGRPYEPIYHFAETDKKRSDVYRHAVEFENATGAEYLGHPTQKPVSLMSFLIQKTSGVVLDPFAGTGSTLRAAKNLGRRSIGIEKDEFYCEVAARRCAQEVLAVA